MVLVTGATGLIGSFICKILVENGFRVRALFRKNSDFGLVSAFKDKIDWVEADVLDLLGLEKAVQGCGGHHS